MKKTILTLIFVSMAAVSCRQADAELTGASWRLTKIISEDGSQMVDPASLIRDTNDFSPITISFTETQATGMSGVNNFFSLIKIDENKMTVSNIGATRKTGSPDMMQLEQFFLNTLLKADHFQIKKDILKISDRDDKVLFVFSLNRLENTTWVLNSLFDGTALVSLPEGFKADISFGKDNSVFGSNGVNRYFGTYTTGTENTISFSNMGVTMMAAPEELMEPAARFDSLLKEVTEYTVSRKTLSFRNAQKTLLMTLTQAETAKTESK